MNAVWALMARPEVYTMGWVLIHFLWQGAALAGLLAVTIRASRTAPFRYGVACACLALMLFCPPATYWYMSSDPAGATSVSSETRTPEPFEMPASANGAAAHSMRSLDLDAYLPAMVMGWLLGVSVFSARLLGGWSYAQYLRRRYVLPVEESLRRKFESLAYDLEITRPVWLLESIKIDVPTVIGWLRPVVLLPAGIFSGLTAAQLEAILVHELAHVRRNDYLVNLLQSVVECLLFYHPAVWWISSVIREERENCCDDYVLGRTSSPTQYAEALLRLEESRGYWGSATVAAAGGDLLERVRRMMGQSVPPRPQPVLGSVCLLALAIGLLAGARMTGAHIPDGYVPAESLQGPVNTNTITIYLGDVSGVRKSRVTDARGRRWVMVRDTNIEGALRVISRLTDLTFIVPESVADLPVTQRFLEGQARFIVSEILGKHGLWYRYESRDVIRVIIPERPPASATHSED